MMIDSPKNLMTDSPKNQPTFHINSVGNLNAGNLTIQGDQIGIQDNAADPEIEPEIDDFQTLDVEFTEIKQDKTQLLISDDRGSDHVN